MSVIAAALKHMLAANMPHEAILAAVEDMERGLQTDEQAERRRAADRDRHREKRLRKSAESADKADVPRASVTRVEDNTSSQKIEPQEENKEERNARNRASLPPGEFESWYRHYPHKVQRGAAERAFPAARQLASLETLIAGLLRYAAKTDDRPWQNPATWLRGKGWLDQPANVVLMARGRPPPGLRTGADFLFAETMDGLNGHDGPNGSQTGNWPDAGEFPGVTVAGPNRRIGLSRDG